MLKIETIYEDAINHYPSYKKITVKYYLFGILICTKISRSDAMLVGPSRERRR